eukprot:638385_1
MSLGWKRPKTAPKAPKDVTWMEETKNSALYLAQAPQLQFGSVVCLIIFVILIIFQLIPDNTFQSFGSCRQTASEYLKEHPEFSGYSVDRAHETMRGGDMNSFNCPVKGKNAFLTISCEANSLTIIGHANGECRSDAKLSKLRKSNRSGAKSSTRLHKTGGKSK